MLLIFIHLRWRKMQIIGCVKSFFLAELLQSKIKVSNCISFFVLGFQTFPFLLFGSKASFAEAVLWDKLLASDKPIREPKSSFNSHFMLLGSYFPMLTALFSKLSIASGIFSIITESAFTPGLDLKNICKLFDREGRVQIKLLYWMVSPAV